MPRSHAIQRVIWFSLGILGAVGVSVLAGPRPAAASSSPSFACSAAVAAIKSPATVPNARTAAQLLYAAEASPADTARCAQLQSLNTQRATLAARLIADEPSAELDNQALDLTDGLILAPALTDELLDHSTLSPCTTVAELIGKSDIASARTMADALVSDGDQATVNCAKFELEQIDAMTLTPGDHARDSSASNVQQLTTYATHDILPSVLAIAAAVFILLLLLRVMGALVPADADIITLMRHVRTPVSYVSVMIATVGVGVLAGSAWTEGLDHSLSIRWWYWAVPLLVSLSCLAWAAHKGWSARRVLGVAPSILVGIGILTALAVPTGDGRWVFFVSEAVALTALGVTQSSQLRLSLGTFAGDGGSGFEAMVMPELRSLGETPTRGVNVVIGSEMADPPWAKLTTLPEGKLLSITLTLWQAVTPGNSLNVTGQFREDTAGCHSLAIELRRGHSVVDTALISASLFRTPLEADDTSGALPLTDVGLLAIAAAAWLVHATSKVTQHRKDRVTIIRWQSLALNAVAERASGNAQLALLRAAVEADDRNNAACYGLLALEARSSASAESLVDIDRLIGSLHKLPISASRERGLSFRRTYTVGALQANRAALGGSGAQKEAAEASTALGKLVKNINSEIRRMKTAESWWEQLRGWNLNRRRCRRARKERAPADERYHAVRRGPLPDAGTMPALQQLKTFAIAAKWAAFGLSVNGNLTSREAAQVTKGLSRLVATNPAYLAPSSAYNAACARVQLLGCQPDARGAHESDNDLIALMTCALSRAGSHAYALTDPTLRPLRTVPWFVQLTST